MFEMKRERLYCSVLSDAGSGPRPVLWMELKEQGIEESSEDLVGGKITKHSFPNRSICLE